MGAGEALKKCQVRNSRFGNFKIIASMSKYFCSQPSWLNYFPSRSSCISKGLLALPYCCRGLLFDSEKLLHSGTPPG
jgi:hypothetical protein